MSFMLIVTALNLIMVEQTQMLCSLGFTVACVGKSLEFSSLKIKLPLSLLSHVNKSSQSGATTFGTSVMIGQI